jgi:hypothetical protein
MQVFIQDLWADLREKRLWPVAALLLAGLIAVPLVLAKSTTQPSPRPAAPAPSSKLPGAGLKVLAAADSAGKGSDLGVFDPKDPFRPPASVLKKSKPQSPPSGAGAGASAAAGSGGSAAAGGGGSSLGGSSGGGSGGVTIPITPTKPTVKTERFAYVIDATFKHDSHKRKIKGMERLDMLPSQDNPLLIFMGVDSHVRNAVFLVDSTLTGAGEGTCKPSADKCSFLYLGPGSEEQFTDQDGDSYVIQVDQIRRVKLGSTRSAKAAKRARKAARARKARHRSGAKAKSSARPRRRFAPPVLIDLLDVATTSRHHSSKHSRNR